MMRPKHKKLTILGIALISIGLSLTLHAADDSTIKCQPKERKLTAGTPVLQGPGVGYPVAIVIENAGCFPVLDGTNDGRFLLLKISEESVGWVNTGLVDSRLNDVDDAPSAKTDETNLFAANQIILRKSPRFNSVGVGKPIEKHSPLKQIGISVDKQWYLVQVANDEGWVPKYQILSEISKPGTPPTAGDGRWASTRDARVTYEKSKWGLEEKAKSTAPSGTGDAAKKEGSTATSAPKDSAHKKATVEKPTEEFGDLPASTDPAVIMGRTQEIRIGVGYGYWQQNYRSDAQNDSFHKYNLITPLGLDMALGYGFRADFPLVVDIDFQAGLTGFESAVDETTTTTVLSGHASPSFRMGWRLFSGSEVDVEAGLRANADLIWLYPLENDDFATAVTGYYFGVGPWLGARSRLSGGTYGMFAFEAAVPIAGYGMLPDPYTRYTDAKNAGEIEPVYEDARPEDYRADPILDSKEMEAPAYVHLAIGVDGRIRYVYAFTDLLQIQLYAGASLRQAWIDGPGYRTGAYSNATVYDLLFKSGIGLTFGL